MFLLSFLSSPSGILTSRKILDQLQRFNFGQDKSFHPGRLGVLLVIQSLPQVVKPKATKRDANNTILL